MESGSIQEVTERLKSWCMLHDRGLARVEWNSAYARQEVVDRLQGSLGGLGISVVEISLPPGGAAHETVARLIEKLRSRSGSVVSITDIEWAFPEHGDRLETLAALSFQRETLASLPVRQIWWIPSNLTGQFVLGVPDLDSWFRLRLHLTEAPPQSADAPQDREQTGHTTVSVAEARIWTDLAQPAFDALQSAGLEREADAILARISVARDLVERKLQELIS